MDFGKFHFGTIKIDGVTYEYDTSMYWARTRPMLTRFAERSLSERESIARALDTLDRRFRR